MTNIAALCDRLLDIAARLDSAQDITADDVEQHIADLRRVVALMWAHPPGPWRRFWARLRGREMTSREWEDWQW